MRVALPAVAVTLIAVANGLFSGGGDSPLGQSLMGLTGGIALLVVLWLLPGSPALRREMRPSWWIAAALAWLLAVALVRFLQPEGTDLPVAPDLFLPRFLGLLGGVCILLAGFLLGQDVRVRTWTENGLIAVIMLHLLIGLAIWRQGGAAAAALQWEGRYAGLIGNANVTAAISAVAGLLALSRWLALGSRAFRGAGLYYAVALLICFYAVALTGARFPALVALAGAAALIGRKVLVAGRLSFGATAFVALLLIGGVVASLTFAGTTIVRTEALGEDGYARLAYWQEFANVALHAPWTGFGPGSFTPARLYYLGESSGLPRGLIIHSPHSLVLQLWLCGGIPYVALMLGAALSIALPILRSVKRDAGDGMQLGRAVAAMVMLLCAQVDILLDMPVGVGLLMLVAGLAWGRACSVEKLPDISSGRRSRR